MRSPRRRRLVVGLLLAPVLTGCFASGGDTSADATLLSRLGVTEGLTELDANGAAAVKGPRGR